MKPLKLKITLSQAYKILHNIPAGSKIRISVKDANYILDSAKGK